MFNFSAINLGCNKNLVDLEFILGQVLSNPIEEVQFFENPEDELVEYVIINTCGFLSSSRLEAEETISYFDSLGKKTIIVGCYLKVSNNDFLTNLKNLYKIIPFEKTPDFNTEIIQKLKNGKTKKEDLGFMIHDSRSNIESVISSETRNLITEKIPHNNKGLNNGHSSHSSFGVNLRRTEAREGQKGDTEGQNVGNADLRSKEQNSQAHIWNSSQTRAYLNADFGYEYLKIAEGCDNKCTFCIIPSIRGKQNSRSIEDIIAEVKIMLKNAIKEIIFIAQDTTRYGMDLYLKPSLIELLEQVENIKGDFKYRLLYMYPDNLTLANLEKLKSFKKFIPYFDIPFQHISKNILKKMGRFYNTENIFSFLDFIKANFPIHHIRTAFIVGFPGETEDDFKQLKDFIKKYRFDSVALFEYHDEPLAASSKLDNKIPSEIAQKRIAELDKIIQKIYLEKKMKEKGITQTGYVVDFNKKIAYIRREIRAPEIDELDEISLKNIISGKIEIGERVKYRI